MVILQGFNRQYFLHKVTLVVQLEVVFDPLQPAVSLPLSLLALFLSMLGLNVLYFLVFYQLKQTHLRLKMMPALLGILHECAVYYGVRYHNNTVVLLF